MFEIIEEKNQLLMKRERIENIQCFDPILNNRIVEKENVEFPLPTHKDVLENKKFPYNTFATLMVNSNYGGVNNYMEKGSFRNYLYDNKMEDVMEFLKQLEEDGAKVTNKRTVERHIKTMLDLGLDLIEVRNTENGIVYMLKSSIDNKYYVKMPYAQIRELLISTNKNMLKLFAFMKYMCNETEFKTIERKFIAEHIGLCSKSVKNLDGISTMLTSLANLGFIEIKEVTKVESDPKGNKTVKTIKSYRLTTIEEYKEAKNRGKIKK